ATTGFEPTEVAPGQPPEPAHAEPPNTVDVEQVSDANAATAAHGAGDGEDTAPAGPDDRGALPQFDHIHLPNYRILGELGRGGMGVVYKAEHALLHRTVALKVILAGSHAGPDQLARFLTEAQAVATLQHPDIIQIFEIGETDGLPYLSLEYVDGGSL